MTIHDERLPAAAVSARPPVPARIDTLDGYRAIAALGVVAYHTAGWVGFIGPTEPGAHIIDNLGNFGVAVFFVISGFLLFRPFVLASLTDTPAPRIASFYIRRGLRIYPAYWLALIGWAIVVTPQARVAGTTIGKLLLIDPYDLSIYQFEVGLGVSWTLTIEVAFYIVLPIYAALMTWLLRRHTSPESRMRRHMVGLGCWYLAGFLYRAWLPSWDGRSIHTHSWLFAYLDWFAVGMLIALASAWVAAGRHLPIALQELANRTWACWICAACSYTAVVVLRGDELHFERAEDVAQTSARFFFQAIAAGLFLLPAMLGTSDGPAMRAMRTRIAIFLGTISYGIYLWHPVVITWAADMADQTTARSRVTFLTILVVSITIPLATISYYGFERPITELYRSRARTRSTLNDAPGDGIGQQREEEAG